MTVKWKGGVGVVEDEKALADLIAVMLTINSIPVCFVAYEGHEAVEKYLESNPKPEIVIMDYRLPRSNGIEVMQEMRQLQSGDPEFVFLSAELGVREKALRAGASAFMVKPVSMKDLVDAIEQAAQK